MRRFTLVVFPDERSALRGFHALEKLQREGNVRVLAAAVAERDDRGALSVKKSRSAAPPGAGVGSLGGGLRSELLAYVGRDLAPGDLVVVAEIEERSVTPMDRWARAVGGRVVCAWWKDLDAGAPDASRQAPGGEADAVQRDGAASIAPRRETRDA